MSKAGDYLKTDKGKEELRSILRDAYRVCARCHKKYIPMYKTNDRCIRCLMRYGNNK